MTQEFEIKGVFGVHEDIDDRDPGPPKHFFELRSDASKYATGRGWYGGTATITRQHVLIVDGQVYLLSNPTPILLDEMN
jgi:hypothetical protein